MHGRGGAGDRCTHLVDVRAAVEKEAHDLDVAAVGGPHQGGHDALVVGLTRGGERRGGDDKEGQGIVRLKRPTTIVRLQSPHQSNHHHRPPHIPACRPPPPSAAPRPGPPRARSTGRCRRRARPTRAGVAVGGPEGRAAGHRLRRRRHRRRPQRCFRSPCSWRLLTARGGCRVDRGRAKVLGGGRSGSLSALVRSRRRRRPPPSSENRRRGGRPAGRLAWGL